MQWRMLSVARASRGSCRIIAHRRYPLPSRSFHLSRTLRSNPQDPNGVPDSAVNNTANNPSPTADSVPNNNPVAEEGNGNQPPAVKTNKDASPYGSASRRAVRNRKEKEQAASTLAAAVPQWFYEKNTIFQDDVVESEAPEVQKVGIHKTEIESEEKSEAAAQGGDNGNEGDSGTPDVPSNRYLLTQDIWDELYVSAKAGLALPAAKYSSDPAVAKAHLILQYPGEDGITFLDAVVKKLASSLNTNIVTLNAQDIAMLCSEQERTDIGSPSTSISELGYEVYNYRRALVSNISTEMEVAEEGDEEDFASESDFQDETGSGVDRPINPFRSRTLQAILRRARSGGGSAKFFLAPSPSSGSRNRDEHAWAPLIDELLSVSKSKRNPATSAGAQSADTAASEGSTSSKAPQTDQSQPDLIVQIQDYTDIQNTRNGSTFLSLLHKHIQARRRAGQRVMLVGTVSARGYDMSSVRYTLRAMQEREYADNFSRTIVVTPAMNSTAVSKVFAEDRKQRIFDINIRHLRTMLRMRLNHPNPSELGILKNEDWSLDPTLIQDSGLKSTYWPFDRIHRVVTLALGSAPQPEKLDIDHIRRGIELGEQSDKIRAKWMADKYPSSKSEASTDQVDQETRLKQLRATCSKYEKKLLNGVVDADHIRTTFSDVHAPVETVDALKTLTSLSLIRPEAFTYGVLSTDKIPGLLLYGPPGTGKTMLAKAVAKESGATVLEVSGSEVYDMYVGEGEKNVKAIFSLAKKLSPCVVFIDEADAIFCSRTGASNRTAHRELINQFLREWDGMNDLSAFIMVATNRPFDLDDAVLRRLPRRLLVDLPTEQDRHSILKLHLKEETIDPSVDLADLASRTPLYSGSDLKNLCVAAALACVREENEHALQHKGEEPYKYPERRTLTSAHFDRAMQEISASISEDMSSLSAVKKFDEKYGDRKGRRKKNAGWGFTPPGEAEKTTETGRVRN
ncbi:hypothetical protein FQN54_004150 [Arachnomyces sp. PD_36]|nr:hypothetical protein FQN54_004150 [Arachnomyces sp. PD_36]